ncbi:MAG TPA: peptide chain release factor 3, partial [Burkholderiales bacterium]|nr:peptide chain release factor 3 [Burkholderiales bacterium]
KKLEEFEKNLASLVAVDAGGSLAYFASSRVNLELVQERWPEIEFHATREHASKLG